MNLGDLDLINPIDGVWGRAAHGQMHCFTFRADGEYSGYEIEKMLRRYGIRIWGRKMEGDQERAFLVKQTQAVWAEYLLCRAGVPLTCALLDPRNEHYCRRHEPQSMPIPWTKHGIGPSSFVDYILDLIDKILP
jgi:hypothetical protein